MMQQAKQVSDLVEPTESVEPIPMASMSRPDAVDKIQRILNGKYLTNDMLPINTRLPNPVQITEKKHAVNLRTRPLVFTHIIYSSQDGTKISFNTKDTECNSMQKAGNTNKQ